jgi:hypothetical protein
MAVNIVQPVNTEMAAGTARMIILRSIIKAFKFVKKKYKIGFEVYDRPSNRYFITGDIYQMDYIISISLTYTFDEDYGFKTNFDDEFKLYIDGIINNEDENVIKTNLENNVFKSTIEKIKSYIENNDNEYTRKAKIYNNLNELNV